MEVRHDYANEVTISSLEQQIDTLISLVYQMVVGNAQPVVACRICTAIRHSTNMCHILREESYEQVNIASGFPGQPQLKYDPYSNAYNSGWRDHHSFGYENPPMNPSTN